MNCENIILTNKARAEKMIRPRLIAFLVLFSAIFVFVLSGMYFLNLKISDLINVNSYLLSSFLFTCIILIIVFFIVPFYNYKQMLKIEKYTKNEKFNENADYVKSLFSDKTKEIEDIINSEKVDFLN